MLNYNSLIVGFLFFALNSFFLNRVYGSSDGIRFSQVDSNLYRSSRIHYNNNEEIEFLQLMGISEVIDLTSETEISSVDVREILEKSGISYRKIDIDSKDKVNDRRKKLELYEGAISYAAGLKTKKVLVHCFFGSGRTGMFVDAYLKTKYHLPLSYRKTYMNMMTSWVSGSNRYHFFSDLPKQKCVDWSGYRFCPRIPSNLIPNEKARFYYESLVIRYDRKKELEYKGKY